MDKMKNEISNKKYKCGDCGKNTGENHTDGCDVERCPKCFGQLLSCDCNFPKITTNEKYLIDNEGKKYKRFIVKNSVEEDFLAT